MKSFNSDATEYTARQPQLYEVSEKVKYEELEGLQPVFPDMFDCIKGIRRDYGFGRARSPANWREEAYVRTNSEIAPAVF